MRKTSLWKAVSYQQGNSPTTQNRQSFSSSQRGMQSITGKILRSEKYANNSGESKFKFYSLYTNGAGPKDLKNSKNTTTNSGNTTNIHKSDIKRLQKNQEISEKTRKISLCARIPQHQIVFQKIQNATDSFKSLLQQVEQTSAKMYQIFAELTYNCEEFVKKTISPYIKQNNNYLEFQYGIQQGFNQLRKIAQNHLTRSIQCIERKQKRKKSKIIKYLEEQQNFSFRLDSEDEITFKNIVSKKSYNQIKQKKSTSNKIISKYPKRKKTGSINVDPIDALQKKQDILKNPQPLTFLDPNSLPSRKDSNTKRKNQTDRVINSRRKISIRNTAKSLSKACNKHMLDIISKIKAELKI